MCVSGVCWHGPSTPASLVAPATATREAGRVLSRRAKLPGAVRACPVCRSTAVKAMRHEVDRRSGRWLLCCGECETWRGFPAAFEAMETLAAQLDRDRRQIARSLQSLARAGRDSEIKVAVRTRGESAPQLRLVTQARPSDG